MGGLTSSNFADEILDNFRIVDYIIRGDAEKPLHLLAQQLWCKPPEEMDFSHIPNLVYRKDGKVVQNSRTYFARSDDLEKLDFVTMDWLLNYQRYAALLYSGVGTIAIRKLKFWGHWLTIGRGCIFNCTYCGGGKKSHSDLAGCKGYVARNPDRVVDDMACLQALGYHQVSLLLDRDL